MKQQSNWKVFFAFAAVYIIWGSTYLALLVGVQSMPPFVLSSVRFLIAGILLYAWCLYKREKWPGWESLMKNGICGILMLFGGTVSIAWAEQYIPSSVAAIIVTSLPFWFIMLDKKQWKYYVSDRKIIAGLVVGFFGVAGLLWFDNSSDHFFADRNMKMYGIAAILFGGLAWASGSLYSKYNPAKNSFLMNASLQLLTAGVFTFIVSYFTGEWSRFEFSRATVASWTALIYLVTMGSIIAYLSYLWLLTVRPATQVSTYVYINPVVAVLLGAAIAGEKISWIQVSALSVILSGVLLVNLSKYRRVGQKS